MTIFDTFTDVGSSQVEAAEELEAVWPNMPWTKPLYSKGRIDVAGDVVWPRNFRSGHGHGCSLRYRRELEIVSRVSVAYHG